MVVKKLFEVNSSYDSYMVGHSHFQIQGNLSNTIKRLPTAKIIFGRLSYIKINII